MAPLPESVAGRVHNIVGNIRKTETIGGGCIAHATRIETERGRFFLKWAEGEAGRTFEAEAAGLCALGVARSSLLVPEPIAAENVGLGPGFLLMEWIEHGAARGAFWTDFGRGLAAMHRHTAEDGHYGFDRDNFIGRTPQRNGWAAAWPDFFRSRRLEPQIGWAREAGRWRAVWTPLADRLLDCLGDLLPLTPPASILHGDLWSGNFLATADGRAALIDPATYYGHRETDLALTELFGGFDNRFYGAYREAWPLEAGYAERREVYNLYHLLNHLNLFGAGYASGVERVLKRFG